MKKNTYYTSMATTSLCMHTVTGPSRRTPLSSGLDEGRGSNHWDSPGRPSNHFPLFRYIFWPHFLSPLGAVACLRSLFPILWLMKLLISWVTILVYRGSACGHVALAMVTFPHRGLVRNLSSLSSSGIVSTARVSYICAERSTWIH